MSHTINITENQNTLLTIISNEQYVQITENGEVTEIMHIYIYTKHGLIIIHHLQKTNKNGKAKKMTNKLNRSVILVG